MAILDIRDAIKHATKKLTIAELVHVLRQTECYLVIREDDLFEMGLWED